MATFKQRMRKMKRSGAKTLEQTRQGVKDVTNINRYNRYLFILETILLVGVVDEYFESLITGLNISIYFHILLLMFSIGVLFVVALKVIEKIGKGTIVWLVRLSSNKILRLIAHIVILSLLFCLYGKVFFGTDISLSFNVALNAT